MAYREPKKRMAALRIWTGNAISGIKVEISDVYRAFSFSANTLPLAYMLVQSTHSVIESPCNVKPAVRFQKDIGA